MALAKWYKIDFHTHTPASSCFPDKSITADIWLNAAKKSGMNAVVVTDHNSLAFLEQIEKVKKDYEKENEFKVFYGIELCVSAEFTHILIIFDDKLTLTEIEDAIIGIGLKRQDWGNTEVNVSEDKLKELCLALDKKIFVIPAHFSANKGLGKTNINAINKYKEFIDFSAIEVRNDEDEREYQNKVLNKAIKETIRITGSDNPSNSDESKHSIEGFGKKYTWIKLSQLSFDGLKQVFIDPEYRCLNYLDVKKLGENFDPNIVNHDYIAGVNISSISHMKNLNLRFSPYLNCIIGGRGTGKSTLVSALNIGINNKSDINKFKVLNETLQKDGNIESFYNFGSLNQYKIVMTKENKNNISYKYEDKNGVVEDPPEFKIDFYGQKEIFNLIEDENNVTENSESPLLKLIDNKIKTKSFSVIDKINEILAELIKDSGIYKNNRNKIMEIPTIKANINRIEAILLNYKKSGLEESRKNRDTLEELLDFCKEKINTYSLDIELSIAKFLNQVVDIDKEMKEKEGCINELNDINKIMILIKDGYKSIIEILESQRKEILEAKKLMLDGQLNEKINLANKEYNEALKKLKNTGSENIQELQDKLQINQKRIKQLLELEKEQKILENKIRTSIDEFITVRLKLTDLRKELINESNINNIRFIITPMAQKNRWKQNLQREFGKVNTFDKYFEDLVNYILIPKDNYHNYKEFLFYLLTSQNGDLTQYYAKLESESRFLKLWSDKQANGTLNSTIKIIPEDSINIKLVEEFGEIDINEGSPGQKSAAILAFILSTGENPLIIDQPEDDLDNSLIYKLIVKSIRKIKNKRQIIIVTHNPNIPVLGDAEGIIILERDKNGKIGLRENKKAGCLEEKTIREGICAIMEGGESAFKKREEKYFYS